jgi:hypothetical protein
VSSKILLIALALPAILCAETVNLVPGELQNGRENRASAVLRTWPRPSRTLG